VRIGGPDVEGCEMPEVAGEDNVVVRGGGRGDRQVGEAGILTLSAGAVGQDANLAVDRKPWC